MTATQVPTNGFISPPPAGPAPQGAGAPAAPQGVPPAGPPPRAPNEQAHQFVGQQPGFVPKPAQAAPAADGAPAQAAAQPDLSSITAILQQALGQAQAPAVPAAQAAPEAAERPAWMPESANTFDVATIEDPIIRSMATVMQTAGKGLDLDRVLGKALAAGDASLIDYAYIAEKGGADAQSIAEIAKGIVTAVGAKADAITQAVYATVGGEQQWGASVAAFNKGAPQELRLTVATMLNSTKANMITAGAKIVAEYGRSSGLMPQQGAALLTGATSGMQGQGLTKTDFQLELRKLNQNDKGYTEARSALFARRQLGQRTGL